MTEQQYHAVQDWFYARPAALKALRLANKLLPSVVYLGYIAMIGLLVLSRDSRLWRALLIPAFVFLGGTLLRKALNFPRPYEVYHTPALTRKNMAGQSFPSRHMFSASVIAVCGLWLYPPFGWVLTAVALLLAPLRVLAGVHFIRDVAVGGLLGALIGWIGFFVLS